MHCMKQEDMKRLPGEYKLQELSTRNIISEELARSDLEAMEKDARYALFYQNQEMPSIRHQAQEILHDCKTFFSRSRTVFRTSL